MAAKALLNLVFLLHNHLNGYSAIDAMASYTNVLGFFAKLQ